MSASDKLVGHVPIAREDRKEGWECMACGRTRAPDEPYAPCADQEKARGLIDAGYAVLPASNEEFERMVAEARGMLS